MSKRTYIYLILSIGSVILLGSAAFAQESFSSPSVEERKTMIEKKKEEEKRKYQTLLNKIQKDNPSEYARLKAQQERQEQIAQILKNFKERRISLGDAKTRLKALIEAQVQDDLKNIDEKIENTKLKIERLENEKRNLSVLPNPENKLKKIDDRIASTQKYLDMLKNTKADPKKLVDTQINKMLGK